MPLTVEEATTAAEKCLTITAPPSMYYESTKNLLINAMTHEAYKNPEYVE